MNGLEPGHGQDQAGRLVMQAVEAGELREREARFRALTESATDAIIAVDTEGHILSWNGGATCLFGYTTEEAVGQPVTMLMPEQYRSAHEQGLHRLASGGRPHLLGQTVELVGRRKDGAEFPIELSLSSWTTGEGQFYGGIIRDVSMRATMEKALRASEERLHTLIRNAPLVLSELDADGVFTFSAGRGLDAMGLPQHASVGRSAFELYHDKPALVEGLRRVLDGKETAIAVTLRGVPFDAHYTPVRDATGRVTGAVAVAVDVSAARAAQAALRQSEERFRLLFDAAPTGMALSTPDGLLLEVNQALCTMLGYSAPELLEQGSPLLTHPDDLAASRAVIDQLLAGAGHSAALEKRYLHRDGRVVWTHYTATLLRDEAGQPLYFIFHLQDITARKQAEAVLREAEERLRAVYGAMACGVLVLDATGEVVEVNAAGQEIIGLKFDALSQRFVTNGHVAEMLREDGSVMPPEERPSYRALVTGAPVRDLVMGFRRLDGGERWVQMDAVPMLDHTGTVRHVVVSFTDITERARLEVELRASHTALERTNRELARSNAELEQFSRVASHDLRSPLHTIGGFAQILQMRYKGRLDAEADEFIDFITAGVARMQALIDALLAYARLDSRAKPHTPVDCAALARDALANLHAALEDAEAAVEIGALPAVMGDATQLGQLMQNLIGNALKFRRSGVAPVVRVWAEREDARWRIAVRDNGIGIDPAHAARVFEMFGRLHTRDEYEGTGIGLAICKRIVERHGGRIWVESQPDQGATFFFTLPAA